MGSNNNLPVRYPIKGELLGGSEGSDWEYPLKNGIVEIEIHYAGVIDSIHFKHADENSGNKFGGSGGTRHSKKFTINWPNEYLTKITGTTVTYNDEEVVGSLTFYTNRNKRYECEGTYKVNVRDFQLSEQNQAVVGFYGRQGNFIYAIGVNYTDPPGQAPIVTTKVISTAITMDKDIPRDVGPWGGNKGKAWDDGRLQGRIIGIDVHVGNGVIHALHYRYKSRDDSDSSPVVLSNKHGGKGATAIYQIELDEDNSSPEVLVGISGFYGAFDGNCCVEYQVVRSISFYTNKGKYGPFGTEIGTFFNSPAYSNAKVVGFHGRSGEYLDAIGVHVEYLDAIEVHLEHVEM